MRWYGYPWWHAEALARLGGGEYHSGSYIQHLTVFVMRMHFAALLLIGVGLAVSVYHFIMTQEMPEQYLHGATAASLVVVLIWRTGKYELIRRETTRRREILESELLSIESCAIMWEAVIVASNVVFRVNGGRMVGYLTLLSAKAKEFCETDFFQIHEWIEGQRAED
jgi:hypothetical protein